MHINYTPSCLWTAFHVPTTQSQNKSCRCPIQTAWSHTAGQQYCLLTRRTSIRHVTTLWLVSCCHGSQLLLLTELWERERERARPHKVFLLQEETLIPCVYAPCPLNTQSNIWNADTNRRAASGLKLFRAPAELSGHFQIFAHKTHKTFMTNCHWLCTACLFLSVSRVQHVCIKIGLAAGRFSKSSYLTGASLLWNVQLPAWE